VSGLALTGTFSVIEEVPGLVMNSMAVQGLIPQ
jgi:hypothetical protein